MEKLNAPENISNRERTKCNRAKNKIVYLVVRLLLL